MMTENDQLINWEQIFDAMGEAVFIADINNNIIKANSSCAKLLNMNVDDIVGKKCYSLMHGMDHPWPGCPFEKSKKDGKMHIDEVVSDNMNKYFLVTASPILNQAGKVIGVVHVSKDITDIKKSEEDLKKKITELERFQRITVDRELKMKELKARIAELEAKKNENRRAG